MLSSDQGSVAGVSLGGIIVIVGIVPNDHLELLVRSNRDPDRFDRLGGFAKGHWY